VALIHPLAFHNGDLVPSHAVQFSPFQTGLLTGWGLFSTLRIYQDVPFALSDHVERLAGDAARLHVDIAEWLPRIETAFSRLIAANAAHEAMARIYFIRNRGGLLDIPGQRATDLVIFTAALRDWGASAKLRLQPEGRHARAPLAATKTLTWSHNLVMLEEATAAGFDDVLLLNERGEVAECTAANLFIVRGGEVYTPPLSSGALPGVTRKVILRAAARQGWAVREAPLRPEDVLSADEVFITSSTREIQSVSHLDRQALPPAGPVTQRIKELFRQAVQEQIQHASPAKV